MNVESADMRPEGRPAVNTLELYAGVWRFAAGGRARYLLAMLLLVGSQSVKLLVPWLAGRAIDTVQTSGTEHIGAAALITVAIFLVHALAWSMHGPGRIIERSVGLRVREAVADALYAKLARLPLAWHEAHHSADMQQRAQQASMALSNFAQSQFLYLQNFVNVVGPLVALSLMSLWTGMLAFAGYVAVACVIIRFDRALLRLMHRQNVLERRYAVRLLDFLGNIGTVLSLRRCSSASTSGGYGATPRRARRCCWAALSWSTNTRSRRAASSARWPRTCRTSHGSKPITQRRSRSGTRSRRRSKARR